MESTKVPQFLLYGEQPEPHSSWFVNIEHLADRCRDRGWRIEPHAHPGFGQLMFARSGRGVIALEGRSVPFESPFVLLLPPHYVHGFNYEVDTDGWVLTIESTYLRQINGRLPEFSQLWAQPRTISLDRDSDQVTEFHWTLKRLEREVESKAVGHAVAAEALLTSLFLMLERCSGLDDTENSATRNELRLVERFRDLIDRHYRQDWQVQDYASVLGVSLVQLRAACVAASAQHPVKMIHSCIITEAKRNLIFGEMSVEQIAYWLGFSDPAYFTRFFKKEVGKTPGKFRKDSLRSP
jgi:AraC family transcriptional regulator, transcriptional activator of pobA